MDHLRWETNRGPPTAFTSPGGAMVAAISRWGDFFFFRSPVNVPFQRLKGVPKNGALPSGKRLRNYGKWEF